MCAVAQAESGGKWKRGMGDVASHRIPIFFSFLHAHHILGGGEAEIVGNTLPPFPISFAPCPGFILGKREEEATTPFAYPKK